MRTDATDRQKAVEAAARADLQKALGAAEDIYSATEADRKKAVAAANVAYEDYQKAVAAAWGDYKRTMDAVALGRGARP